MQINTSANIVTFATYDGTTNTKKLWHNKRKTDNAQIVVIYETFTIKKLYRIFNE